MVSTNNLSSTTVSNIFPTFSNFFFKWNKFCFDEPDRQTYFRNKQTNNTLKKYRSHIFIGSVSFNVF